MKKEKATKHVAVLADDGTLLRFDDVEKLTVAHVEVPNDCDLVPGKYKWHDRLKRFNPIMKTPPDLAKAVAAGFSAIKDIVPLPKETLEFIAWMEQRKSGDN